MTNVEELMAALREVATSIESIEALPEGGVVVRLPDYRQAHDGITVSIEPTGDSLVVSDLGATSFLIGDEFDAVIDAMTAAGARFVPDRGQLVSRVVAGDPLDAAWRVLAFVADVSAAPMVWHSMACSAEERIVKPTAQQVMAREVRTALVGSLGRAEPFLKLDQPVLGARAKVRAPLQFTVDPKRPPRLVVGCLDLMGTPQGRESAWKSTSHMWVATETVPRLQRYLVVRGADQDIEDTASMYDPFRITTLGSQSLEPLVASVEELLIDVLG